MRFNTISFLSDYGLDDEFVGVVHSVVRGIAPEVKVIDINHNVAPHDVRAGGLVLARAVPYMAPGVALAVVDPGVGSARRAVAVEVADGGAFLIGPDNGLLAPAVAMVGGATAAVVLDNPEYQLVREDPESGAAYAPSTFDGRDVFAPTAAHLCNGVPLDELGSALETTQLMPGLLPVAQTDDDGSIRAEILWIDRFGNAQINLEPEDLAGWPGSVTVETRSPDGRVLTRSASRVTAFADIGAGAVGLLVDSAGLLALAVDRGSAAREIGLSEGDEVTLRPGSEEANRGSTSAVSLGPTRERPKENPL